MIIYLKLLSGGGIFLIGNYVAENVKLNKFSGKYIFIFGLVFFVIKSVTSLKKIHIFCDMSVGMLSISVIFIFIPFIKSLGKVYRDILVRIGSISLESYLFNIFLLQAVKYWKDIFLTNEGFMYRFRLYISIMILGISLAFVSSVIIKKIMNTMEEIKCQHLAEKL